MPDWKVIRWLKDERGAVAPLVGLILTAVLGFAGLGIEVGLWQLEKRKIQGAADAAASSAATAIIKGEDETAQARAVAAAFGYQHGFEGVTVTVNRPPTSGSKVGVDKAVEVIIRKGATPLLSGFFLEDDVDIGGRAVASVQGTGGEFCVLALEVTAQSTELKGTAWLNMPTCGLGVNSANSQALRMTGTSQIDASHVSIVGGYSTTSNATINTTESDGVATGQAPLGDPYADVEIPDISGMPCIEGQYPQSNVFAPGRYCGGIDITGTESYTMNPGIYYIDGGEFDIAGSTVIHATGGVTIVLTSSSGSNHANLSVSGSGKLNLTAPTSGPFAGLAIIQDRNADSDDDNRITGSSVQNITGAVYFPKQEVTWTGTTQPGGTECTQLIVRAVTFVGTSDFKSNCAGTGTRPLGTSTAALFE